MLGHPVWGIRQVIGSFMYLEFGKPHLWIREPRIPCPDASPIAAKVARQRKIYPAGEWHLMLHMCAWRIILDSKELAHSESTREQIASVAHGDVMGRILEKILIELDNSKTTFTFENGLSIEASKPSAYTKADADRHEQWSVAEESGDILAFRGDGSFSFLKGDSEPSDVVWWICEGVSEIVIN